MAKKLKQWEAVVETMRSLGGIATLGKLNQEVFKIEECEWKTKTPFASIRRIVQQTPEYIYKIKPGLYGLVECKSQLEANGYIIETERNKSSKAAQDFNHSFYQGILLELGKLNRYDTYIPNQDKNKHFDMQNTLGSLSSLDVMPEFTYPDLVHRSSTIDVIWFNERMLPNAFYEIEHSTDIQNSLLKYNDMQDFYVKMFIVADERREDEFKRKLNYAAFQDINKRVQFLSYNKLMEYYHVEVKRASLGFSLK